MPFTLVAFFKDTENATLLAIQPIADQHVTVSGDDLTTPELNQIVGAIFCANQASAAQIRSPSLRRLFMEEIGKLITAERFRYSSGLFHDHRVDPIPLVTAEKLNVYMTHGSAGWALLWLADGPIEPIHGNIRTIKATTVSHGAENAWTNSALSLNQTLPAGRYAVVGMRVFGVDLLAARLVFVGYSWRPGVPANKYPEDADYPRFRNGRFGLFGEFEFDNPPTIDLLGMGVSSGEEVFLDLIQVREGRS